MQISDKEYKELLRAQAKLSALEAGGVDNWEWYDESLKDYHKDNELAELKEKFIEEVMEILSVDCGYEFPAGREAGISIFFSDEQQINVDKALSQFICDYDDLEEEYK